MPILHLCADCINVVESVRQYSKGRCSSSSWSNLHADLVKSVSQYSKGRCSSSSRGNFHADLEESVSL